MLRCGASLSAMLMRLAAGAFCLALAAVPVAAQTSAPQDRKSAILKRSRNSVDDLVVHGSAEQRMRMTDDSRF